MLEYMAMVLPSAYITYGLITLIVLNVLGLCWLISLQLKIRRILGGKSAKDLESVILELHKNTKENATFRDEMRAYLLQVEKRLKRALQGVETMRFDAFKGVGSSGNQSFATAYVNEKGDGVVISSLSARERVSLFSKPIKEWKSNQELSPEEKEVIEKAKQTLSV